MLMARTKGVYKCAIGYIGVYDLQDLFTKGDVLYFNFGNAYLEEVLGTNKEVLSEFSPVSHIENINEPVLLIHGRKDARAPIDSAKKLNKLLKKQKKNVDFVVYGKSGHGVRDLEDQKDLYSKVLKFLNKHIGKDK